MKQRIVLTESKLRNMIKESVRQIVNEYNIGRGKTSYEKYDPVPYDDDYVEEFGPTNPLSDEDEQSYNYVSNETEGLVQRIEKALFRIGCGGVNVTAEENTEDIDQPHRYTSRTNVELTVSFSTIDANKHDYSKSIAAKAISTVIKILNSSEFVKNFEITEFPSGFKNGGLLLFAFNLSVANSKNPKNIVPKDGYGSGYKAHPIMH